MQVIGQKLLIEAIAEQDVGVTPRLFRQFAPLTTKHLVEWSEGVSVGEVTIEEAASEDYTGTWAPVAVVTFDGSVTPAPKVDSTNTNANGMAYRHRITLRIEGGTVTTKISGSE